MYEAFDQELGMQKTQQNSLSCDHILLQPRLGV